MAEVHYLLVGGQPVGAGGAEASPVSLRKAEFRQEFAAHQVDDALDNLRHALSLGLPQWQPVREARRGTLCIVGGGPSLDDTLVDLQRVAARRHTRVLALNDAIDYLRARNIPVWGTVFMEVAAWRPEFMNDPPEGLTYLVASVAHPEVYRKLEGRNVVQWHPLEGIGEDRLIREVYPDSPLVGGGCTAATRALYLGYFMGFRRFELFGLDSSHRPDRSHAYLNREGQDISRVFCAGEWFDAPGYLLRQADDFRQIMQQHGADEFKNLRVHGSGLLPHIAMALGVHAKSEKRNIQ